MRYGSVPDGFDLSMTHIEYDEAQRCEMPSLIYTLDESAQPILPKYVETGPGADSLQRLKEQLRKRHLVSSFTTPEDLSAKILHDVPEVLTKIGAEVEGELPSAKAVDSAELLRQFQLLPKMVRGRDMVVEFKTNTFRPANPDICEALSLEAGATVRGWVTLSGDERVNVYASDELARKMIALPEGSRVRVNAVIIYGVTKGAEWGEDGPITTTEEHSGFRIKDVLDVAPPEAEEGTS